jgi:hypothetical protein
MYFHKIFYYVTFYEKNMQGIYYILSFEANKPNQFRLLIPFIFKAFKTAFFFVPDQPAYFAIILVLTFFTVVLFYNILNVYFENKNVNQWLAFIIFYPLVWHYLILNQMFEFTDFANLFFTFLGYYCVINNLRKTMLLVFLLGTFNHDSIGFLIVMFLLFNYKVIFKSDTIFYTAAMTAIFIIVKRVMEYVFEANTGVSFRFNYMHNISQFTDRPVHHVVRNIFLFFGGMHWFILYFFVSGLWKKFKTKYLYITLTIIPHIIIVFLIHTTFEARNYINVIPFILILFLYFISTQKYSFLKPLNETISK